MKLIILLLPFQTANSQGAFLSKGGARGEPSQRDASVDLSAASPRRHIVGFVSSQSILDKIFDSADINHDGSVNFSEMYELVLKFYISINRQAPVPPPSKKRVLQLFLNADTSHNNRLSREEFMGLANLLAGSAVVRVTAHKLVTLVGAPLLAETLMHAFTGTGILNRVANLLVPNGYKAKIIPIITSHAFCRTVLVIVLVSTLGNVVLDSVNWVLQLQLGDEDKDERLKDIDKIE